MRGGQYAGHLDRSQPAGGSAADWAEAMLYVEETFMPNLLRSQGRGPERRCAAHYFPGIDPSHEKWYRVQLLLFKPHQDIYDYPQPLLSRSETAEEACISSNVICEHCKCPLKKLFQHGCDQKSCVVRSARQRIDQRFAMVPRAIGLGTILMVGVYWQFYFDKSPETICWFKLLSLFVMAGGSFRVSGFLALRVDDPFPRPWIGYIGVEFHNKFIKDSPGEEYVTRSTNTDT